MLLYEGKAKQVYSTENENSKITETDIESVKEFLISEYGVSKSCLKIN